MSTKPQIMIGADHRGFMLKEQIEAWLIELGYQVTDCGSHAYVTDDDYPTMAAAVGSAVVLGDASANLSAQPGSDFRLGILLCGSSIGVTIAANKINGVRAGSGFVIEEVVHGRAADDINVLTLAADHTSLEQAKSLVSAFVNTPFDHSDRSIRRLAAVQNLERTQA